jgi:hypothetical protein
VIPLIALDGSNLSSFVNEAEEQRFCAVVRIALSTVGRGKSTHLPLTVCVENVPVVSVAIASFRGSV